MSFDLVVFDPSRAPRDRVEFLAWLDSQSEWLDDVDYSDPSRSTPPLQRWFTEISAEFPPLNGPLAEVEGFGPTTTDYSIGDGFIYCAFGWEVADAAWQKVQEIATKHAVGVFNASSEDGEMLLPTTG